MNIEHTDSINQYDLWYRPDVNIIQAQQFLGSPKFYPVYRYENFYSWSLLELIRYVGCVDLNKEAMNFNCNDGFSYLPATLLPVNRITRIGGPLSISAKRYRTEKDFVSTMAIAMAKDIEIVESRLKDYTNVILTGGKDSLNMLLLPWRNPVIVASAAPNAVLVQEFINRNNLPHQFVELRNDDDNSLLKEEMLSNCGRINIQHMRWQRQCRDLGYSLDGKALFWGGSLGDSFMTTKWRTIQEIRLAVEQRQLSARIKRFIELKFYKAFPLKLQQRYFNVVWNRMAMWQAVSKAIHREVTGCLSLSGYHGDNVLQCLSDTVLADCVNTDVRVLIGAAIAGRPVEYPAENPSPPMSNRPSGISDLQRWVNVMREEEIALC